jgi:hypothetical protein
MALGKHEIYMIWRREAERAGMTPEGSLEAAWKIMGLSRVQIEESLRDVLLSLLMGLPGSLLDGVRYGVQISPPAPAIPLVVN